jgi:aminopeptidase N
MLLRILSINLFLKRFYNSFLCAFAPLRLCVKQFLSTVSTARKTFPAVEARRKDAKMQRKTLSKILTTGVFIFLMLMTTSVFAQTPPLEPGVAQTLAKWRAANYSGVSYKLNLALEKGAPLMRGEIEIHVTLTDEGAKNDLILDWRTTQFGGDKDKPFAKVTAVNNTSVTASNETMIFLREEHLIVASALLKSGENVVNIQFASPVKTSGAAITRYIDKEDGTEYVYSLFVPSDASTAFPVFDQPDLKAKFSLELKTPISWKVVSNTAVENSSTLRSESADSKQNQDGYTKHTFSETKPISTYVFAFAAGDFAEFTDDFGDPGFVKTAPAGSTKIYEPYRDPNRSKIYVRKSQAEKFRAHEKEVFRLNREGVKFLESWFDYKFPFPKYDLVLIPEFPFGGMEHAGATFLKESSIIFPTEPTKNDYVSRANVMFHEAAHQWFGDTVTMRWFDDLWLKEGFAEFMAYKTLEKVMPEYNAWKIFYERNKQAAYLTDSTRGTTPIYQEIANLSAAKSAYGNIVYRKAPSFLRQAEFYLGEDKFQTAVRAFLKNHEFANAEWTDLVKEFETASGQDLKDWADGWVKQRGLGKISIIPESEPVGGVFSTYYNVKEENVLDPGQGSNWKQSVRLFVLDDKQGKQTFNVTFEKVTSTGKPENVGKFYAALQNSKNSTLPNGFEFLITNQKPIFIFPNYRDYGYGIFLLDAQSRVYVLQNIQSEKDDFLRTMMWGSLWDSVREAELAPETYVNLVIKVLSPDFSRPTVAANQVKSKSQNMKEKPGLVRGGTQNVGETDESTIQTLLGRVSAAMNYYLNDTQRNALAPRLEALLVDKIANAQTQGQRITFYRAFLTLASSLKAAQILKDILAGKSKVAVFQLKTKDKFDIVTRLLIMGDKDAPNLLAALEKTETSDEAKRYAYAARAGVGTSEAKAQYFRDFVKNKDISESWIEAAFAPFNSVRHSDLTLQYLETALSELPNLKKNRKIFFVNGWLGAFIGGQKSEEALAAVNKFLADNPNLDKDLRLKILENVDGLERAVKIRAKYGK